MPRSHRRSKRYPMARPRPTASPSAERRPQKTVAARAADGRDAKVPYVPGSAPGSWQPTPPYMSPASGVQFGAVKPFFPKNADQFALPGPLAITSAEYAKEINEVRELGSANSTKRTAAQTAIAIFWTDSPTHVYGEVAQAASEEHELFCRRQRAALRPDANGDS